MREELSKLQAVAASMKSAQEGTARELVDAQTSLREAQSALAAAKDKVAHFKQVGARGRGRLGPRSRLAGQSAHWEQFRSRAQ